ncbi:ATP synthase F1 subunit gamma [Candidatus Peregrinibacteria bacterium]|nr:ATP synthase F1 subunit gamma [Candidatus Peregrinibacteria bacterium]
MASLREIKLRIRTIKSTQKITKAMEMVAASKMRRAQTQALRGRAYMNKLTEMIARLAYYSQPSLTHPFLTQKSELKNVTYILLTSNRGLCGAYNTNVIRSMLELLAEKNETEELVITVGSKGRQAMERIGKRLLADFEKISDHPSYVDTLGISQIIMDDFLSNRVQQVFLVYNHFYSTLLQKPVVKKLLPVEPDRDIAQGLQPLEYIFEQDRSMLLDEVLKKYIETSVYQTILESLAAEQSARMMAMRQASDNASEIVENLTLHYNKARQSKITTQILEVVSGSKR